MLAEFSRNLAGRIAKDGFDEVISKEEYDRWRYHYPDFDDSSIRIQIPPDIPVKAKRGRKPKKKE